MRTKRVTKVSLPKGICVVQANNCDIEIKSGMKNGDSTYESVHIKPKEIDLPWYKWREQILVHGSRYTRIFKQKKSVCHRCNSSQFKSKKVGRNMKLIILRSKGKTYEQIAKKFGLTRERVRQCIHNALRMNRLRWDYLDKESGGERCHT